MKIRMRLDAGDGDDVVGLVGVNVELHGHAVIRAADLHRFHGGANGRADDVLRQAVALEDGALALGGGAAVAAHCGNDERLGAAGAHIVHHRADDGLEIGDLAAAAADAHAHAGAKRFLRAAAVERLPHGGGHVLDALGNAMIAHAHKAGNDDIVQQRIKEHSRSPPQLPR